MADKQTLPLVKPPNVVKFAFGGLAGWVWHCRKSLCPRPWCKSAQLQADRATGCLPVP